MRYEYVLQNEPEAKFIGGFIRRSCRHAVRACYVRPRWRRYPRFILPSSRSYSYSFAIPGAMSDLDDSSGTHLLSLTLARALQLDMENTREICFSGRTSISALSNEVRSLNLFTATVSHRIVLARRNRIHPRRRPATSRRPARRAAADQPAAPRAPPPRIQLPRRRRLRRPRLARLPKVAAHRAGRAVPLDRHPRIRR